MTHFNSSRPWIGTTGNKKRRITTLTFVLGHPARVIFTVKQLSPGCRMAGRFSVRGHAGFNRVPFAGRIGRRRLDPGTYRITARTADGRTLQRVTVVLVDGPAPTKTELVALRASNVCASNSGFASTSGFPSTSGFASTALNSTGASNTGVVSESINAVSESDDRGFPEAQPSASGPTSSGSSGVLGSATVEKAARAIRPALIALLAAAILLLGLASMPRVSMADARVNDALARHRTEIAGVGAAAFVAVVIAFLLA